MNPSSVIFFCIINLLITANLQAQSFDYSKAIKEDGQDPLTFVNEKLDSHGLIIFDDGLHSAAEPFDFYRELVKSEKFQEHQPFIFLELIHTHLQPILDAYFSSPEKDSTLLIPVFQTDYSGYGLRYQTYLDLLSTVWDVNKELPDGDKIKVIGVNQPIYWEAIHSRKEYDLFLESLIARDYYMFAIMEKFMAKFREGRKGIFITNTRHAYKKIRNRSGNLHHNTATFFYQHYPGKSYTIRIDNVFLHISEKLNSVDKRTAEGLDQYSYNWKLINNGAWNEAVQQTGGYPVAVPVEGNAFGNTLYVGNLQKGQTISDAYDALIFLKPPPDFEFSGAFSYIYSPDFIKELRRRISVLYEGRIKEFLNENAVSSIDEYIEKMAISSPRTKNTLTQQD